MATSVKIAEMSMVERKTKTIMVNNLPNFFVLSIFAIAEDTAKNTNGITAVNNRFKNMSPSGFILSTLFPKIKPTILPTVIPAKSHNKPE